LLTWNLWVVIGIVVYLALVAAAIVTWPKRPRRQLAVVTQDKSPIDALLARADAVLRGGTLVGSGQPDKSSGSEHANARWSVGGNGEVSVARQGAAAANGEAGRDSKTGDNADTGTSRPTATAPRPAR
jgi:hypothetical protein